MHDVVIVGAGPVGLFLAHKLSDLDVVILESKDHIGKKPCSGLISTNLEKFVPVNKDFLEHEVRGAKIHFNSGTINLVKEKTAAYVLDRSKFDKSLAKSLESKIKLNTKFIGFEKAKDHLIVETTKGKLNTKLLVGCDGASSSVRDFLGYRTELVNGLIATVSEKNNNNFVELWYDKKITDGFLWKIPRGETTEYGILGKNAKFLDLERFFDLKDYERMGALIPIGSCKSYAERVLLVGDAAGQVKPWSIDGEESIIIKENGLIKNVKIEEVVNNFRNNKIKNIYAFSPSKNASLLNFMKIKSCLEHKLDENMFEIITNKGYRVKTTGSHSVICVNDFNLMPKKVSELEPKKDHLLFTSSVPNNANNITELNLINLIIKKYPEFVKKIRVRGGKKLLFSKRSEVPINYRTTYWDRDSIPLKLFLNEKIIPKDVRIVYEPPKKKVEIPNIIKITPEFCRILGYYIAEGDSSKGKHIHMSLGKDDIKNGIMDDLIDCIGKTFGINISFWKPRKNPYTKEETEFPISFGGKLLAKIFTDILETGKNAYNKQIPYIIFNISDEVKIEFLKAYMKGDGFCRVRMPEKRRNWSAEISSKTASRKLASDIIILSLQLGLFPSVEESESRVHSFYNKKIKTSKSYKISFSSKKDLEKLSDIFPNKIEIKKYLNNIKSRPTFGFPKNILSNDMINELIKTEVGKYISNRCKNKSCNILSYEKLLKGLNKIGNGREKEFIKKLIKNKMILLPIKEIRKIKTNRDVFDIEVPKSNMFIGGLGPLILHNSGGGVVYGFTAAEKAAETIQKALRENNFSESFLSQYEKEWESVIGKGIRKGLLFRRFYKKFPASMTYRLMKLFEKRLNKTDMDIL